MTHQTAPHESKTNTDQWNNLEHTEFVRLASGSKPNMSRQTRKCVLLIFSIVNLKQVSMRCLVTVYTESNKISCSKSRQRKKKYSPICVTRQSCEFLSLNYAHQMLQCCENYLAKTPRPHNHQCAFEWPDNTINRCNSFTGQMNGSHKTEAYLAQWWIA